MPRSGGMPSTIRHFADLYNSLDYPDSLDRLAHIDMKHFFIGDLMMKNDRMMMANSVEARFPFMDRLAVEFFTTIPSRYKIRGLTRRYIEKRAMKRVLPPEIHGRQNFGIELPYSHWLGNELRNLGGRYFNRDTVDATGLLDYGVVNTLWEDHISGRRDNGRTLWCLLNFLIWFELFVDRKNFRDYISPA